MHEINAKSILSPQNGMNIYRGCSHGCIYCDSRSKCYNMKHEFEDIEIKKNAADLLEHNLKHKRKRCMIGTGAMSDPYLHIEKDLKLTRRCLKIIDQYEFGLAIQTKSDLILRDLDILKSINAKTKCVVQMTLTTFDDELCKIVEPNVCVTSRRAEVLNILRDEGIPTVCWFTPMLPFINDTKENVQGILEYCKTAKTHGIIMFGAGMTLRDGNRQYYYEKLDEHFPGLKDKYVNTFGNSYDVPSPNAKELMNMVYSFCNSNGIEYNSNKLFEYMRMFEDKMAWEQLSLFG